MGISESQFSPFSDEELRALRQALAKRARQARWGWFWLLLPAPVLAVVLVLGALSAAIWLGAPPESGAAAGGLLLALLLVSVHFAVSILPWLKLRRDLHEGKAIDGVAVRRRA